MFMLGCFCFLKTNIVGVEVYFFKLLIRIVVSLKTNIVGIEGVCAHVS